jgi:DNA-binding MarR family transcriptional regulator
MAAKRTDHPVVQVFDAVRHIDNEVRAAFIEVLPRGLTFAQYEVIDFLERRGDGAAPADIARGVHAAKSGLTNTLQRLEAAGLVRVQASPEDGRRKQVWLTAQGRAAYAQTLAGIRPRLEHLKDALTTEEFRAALPFLRALQDWFEEKAWAIS